MRSAEKIKLNVSEMVRLRLLVVVTRMESDS